MFVVGLFSRWLVYFFGCNVDLSQGFQVTVLHCLFIVFCRYTYGKPVIGSVKAVLCRQGIQHFYRMATSNICKTYPMQARQLKNPRFLFGAIDRYCYVICVEIISYRLIEVAVPPGQCLLWSLTSAPQVTTTPLISVLQ